MTQHSTIRPRRTTPASIKQEPKERFDQWEDDDYAWEDEEEMDEDISTANSGRATPRTIERNARRRGLKRAANASSSPRKQPLPTSTRTKPSSPPLKNRDEPDGIVHEAFIQGVQESTYFIGKEVLHISAIILRWLRIPIALFVVFMLLSVMLNRLTPTIRRTVRPFCIIPGISNAAVCMPLEPETGAKAKGASRRADYTALVDIQSKSFEQLLEEAAGGNALSLEIKKAEMATSDLAVRVRISNLNSKDVLATTLDEFVADALKTGRGLQKLTAKVNGAVDSIMAVNDYALQSIGEARTNEPSPWSLAAIAPWRPRQNLNEIVTKTFDEAMNVMSGQMQRLIVEAEYSHANLMDLEEKLTTLHEIVSREDSGVSEKKSELLGDLWTKVGGNRQKLRTFDHHLALLKGLSTYREQARVHVVSTLQTLRAMNADMEDMRERVAAPELMATHVPVEVHMKSIRMGLERLRESRMRAKKLEEDAMKKVMSIGEDSSITA